MCTLSEIFKTVLVKAFEVFGKAAYIHLPDGHTRRCIVSLKTLLLTLKVDKKRKLIARRLQEKSEMQFPVLQIQTKAHDRALNTI